jgi:hypothetical protein
MNAFSKLSKLQRWILSVALENSRKETGPMVSVYTLPPPDQVSDPRLGMGLVCTKHRAHLTRRDILIGYFAFPPMVEHSWGRFSSRESWDAWRIGQKRYQSAQASCSRALHRLIERDLIKVYQYEHAIELTEKGFTLAKSLKLVGAS